MPTLHQLAKDYADRLDSLTSLKALEAELEQIFYEISGLVTLPERVAITEYQTSLLLQYLRDELQARGFTSKQIVVHEDIRPSLENLQEVAKSLSICNDQALDLISMMASRTKENK
ncbi:TPA: hypothetical protein MYP99_005175 [Citrobacter freundii]|nr:hypothetical protein [Citrobacter freundii]